MGSEMCIRDSSILSTIVGASGEYPPEVIPLVDDIIPLQLYPVGAVKSPKSTAFPNDCIV